MSRLNSVMDQSVDHIISDLLISCVRRAIYDLGIEPVDCALRNVLWEHETKRW